jgi:Type IV secretion system pilin
MQSPKHIDVKIKKISTQIFVLMILFSPIFVHVATAAGSSSAPPNTNLIVCNTSLNKSSGTFNDPCTFQSLVTLAQNLINFLIYLSIPLAAVSFVWAGFKIMTAAGNVSQVKQGKDIFVKVAIGLIFVLAAWLIVNVILTALLVPGQGYSLLSNS